MCSRVAAAAAAAAAMAVAIEDRERFCINKILQMVHP